MNKYVYIVDDKGNECSFQTEDTPTLQSLLKMAAVWAATAGIRNPGTETTVQVADSLKKIVEQMGAEEVVVDCDIACVFPEVSEDEAINDVFTYFNGDDPGLMGGLVGNREFRDMILRFETTMAELNGQI